MKRIVFLAGTLVSIVGIIAFLATEKCQPPIKCTLSPILQTLGRPINSGDRALTRLMPIDEFDERAFADEIKRSPKDYLYLYREGGWEKDEAYLNSLIQSLTAKCRKQFEYKVYLIYGSANAYALPGGIICVTEDLLKILGSESELVALLSHEIGHIEREHLFQKVRAKLLSKKSKTISIAISVADAIGDICNMGFSQIYEDEADCYGFDLLVSMGYHPLGLRDAFQKLEQRLGKAKVSLFSDFFNSHPYVELRKSKFKAQAENWMAQHPDQKMYVGTQNLIERTCRFEKFYESESR